MSFSRRAQVPCASSVDAAITDLRARQAECARDGFCIQRRHAVQTVCRGGLNDDATSTKAMLLLAASASISWVFAKSIQNASLVRHSPMASCKDGVICPRNLMPWSVVPELRQCSELTWCRGVRRSSARKTGLSAA